MGMVPSGNPAWDRESAGVPTRDVRAERVRAQLAKITSSAKFASSERLRDLIEYIINEALQGRNDRIREYDLAIAVFHRPASFDPQLDAIVRVEMGRLRARLREYYTEEGQSDPILIQIRPRSYEPVFVFRGGSQTTVDAERRPVRWRFPWPAVAVVIFLTGFGGVWLTRHPVGKQKAPPISAVNGTAQKLPSIVVLPFTSLGTNENQGGLTDGFAEDLIDLLTHVEGLRVISPTSSLRAGLEKRTTQHLVERFGVDYALSGSVRTSRDELTAIVRLTDLQTGFIRWSKRYEIPQRQLGELTSDVLQQVAGLLQLHVPEAHMPRGHYENEQNLDSYFRGLATAGYMNAEFLRKSVGHLERAAQSNPNCARIHALLAKSLTRSALLGEIPPLDAMQRAKAAAARSLMIDDQYSHAHAAMALVKGFYDWEWKEAEREFQTAIRLDPNDVGIREEYILGYLVPQGRLGEALSQLERSRSVDPLSPNVAAETGLVHFFRKDYEKAIISLAKAVELDQRFQGASIFPTNGSEARLVMDAWRRGVEKDKVRYHLAHLRQRSKVQYVSGVRFAALHVVLGERSSAIEWLERAVEQHAPELAFLKANPIWTDIHYDPRFSRVLDRLGLDTN
ncbi:MAG: hypothetical protein ABFD89_11955 [Bryobacteraceae bacterium]